jgi:putative tryptophan/tyrosine transport system substrate-binding protein
MAGNPAVAKANLKAFQDRLRELNYVEGRDVVIEYRWAEGNMSRLPDLAKDLVRQNVDLIVTGGSPAAQAAKNATSVVPIVSAGAGDLAESGLVASLAQPGGNLTGVAVAFPETAGKQVEIMQEVLVRPRSAAVLWEGPSIVFFQRQRSELEKVTTKLTVTWHAAGTRSDLEPACASIAKSGPDFLVVLSSAFFFSNRRELANLVAQTRVPAVYGFREYVEDGGLISYGASIAESFRGAAGYVDRILRGAKPAELPVQMPSKLDLAINLQTAKALGLTIPRSVLSRADYVIGEKT